jgi:ABC-2 type transport system ATP-binding protein
MAALGSPAALTRDRGEAEITFSADPALDVDVLAKALGLDKGSAAEVRPGEYVVRAAATPARIADLACFLRDRDATLTALRSGQRSLETVFLQITSEAEAAPASPRAPRGRRGHA